MTTTFKLSYLLDSEEKKPYLQRAESEWTGSTEICTSYRRKLNHRSSSSCNWLLAPVVKEVGNYSVRARGLSMIDGVGKSSSYQPREELGNAEDLLWVLEKIRISSQEEE